MKRTALVLLCSLWGSFAVSSPVEDLSSPDQAVRDKAAESIRKTYKPIPESKWSTFVSGFKKDQPLAEVEKTLRTFVPDVHKEDGDASGGIGSVYYPLDIEWTMVCAVNTRTDSLIEATLQRSVKSAWIKPPHDFTGMWTVYYVNGQKRAQINYKNGGYWGEFISFHPDGSKSVVQHYDENGANGEDTGYYPSGTVKYRGQYKDGKRVGIWTHYDESGNVTSMKDETPPQ